MTTSSRMQDMYKRFLWDMGAKLACGETSERRPSLSRNITSLSGSRTPGGAEPNQQESGFTGAGCSVNSCPGNPVSETTVTECGMSLSSMSSQPWNDIVKINCMKILDLLAPLFSISNILGKILRHSSMQHRVVASKPISLRWDFCSRCNNLLAS